METDARWLTEDDQPIAVTQVADDVEVSTVLLTTRHHVSTTGTLLRFETMVFGGALDDACWRTATVAEAEAAHVRAVALATACLTAPPCPAGSLCEECVDAPATQVVAAPWGGDMGVCAACAWAARQAGGR